MEGLCGSGSGSGLVWVITEMGNIFCLSLFRMLNRGCERRQEAASKPSGRVIFSLRICLGARLSKVDSLKYEYVVSYLLIDHSLTTRLLSLQQVRRT